MIILGGCSAKPTEAAQTERSYIAVTEEAETNGNITASDAANGAEATTAANSDNNVLHTAAFNFGTKTVMLNSGYEMPIIGLGTYRLSTDEAEESVYNALKDGYRLIDTANAYMNERAVGRGIKRAIDEGFVTRGEIFLTTKLWVSEYDRVQTSIDETLSRLGLDYIDLLLLHQSYGNYTGAYKELENAVKAGKVRSIGLSNFYEKKFGEVIAEAEIMPAVLQVETHPYFQERDMKEYIDKYGTVLESWYPLGGRGNTQTLFNDPTISQIAADHGKTSAQIILRWHLQAGNIAIPGSSDPDHILENYSIFDFGLSDDEMDRMTALDRDQRFYVMSEEDEERMFTAGSWDFNNQR